MQTLWTYPWTLFGEGLESSLDDLAARGVDAITVASHYHSVRSMHPRTPARLFESRAGGCYFRPRDERFDSLSVEPIRNDVFDADGDAVDDPLEAAVEAAADRGIDVNAWTVLTHNSRLGAENPEFRIESAFGDAHDHALCPSNPEVRAYFAAVVAAAADRGVSQVHLEKVGYPSVFHGHGWEFGHDKHHVGADRSTEMLCSQCFCDACRRRAREEGVDVERARDRVRGLLRETFASPGQTLPSPAALAAEFPEIAALLEVRSGVVADLLEQLAEASGDAALAYYVSSDARSRVAPDEYDGKPGDGWPAGVRLRRIENHLDRALVSCYVADPAAARERIATCRRLVDLPVDAGITLVPATIPDAETLEALVATLADAVDGDVSVYHDSLATDAHREWLERGFDGA